MFQQIQQFANLMRNAGQIQSRIGEVREALKKIRVSGSAGAGAVTVWATGDGQVVDCRLDRQLIASLEPEMLESLIVGATSQALDKAKEAARESLQKVLLDLGIDAGTDPSSLLSQLGLGS